MPTTSVLVVPCFNEAERLDAEAWTTHARLFPQHRFLLVDDGSTDETPDRLRALEAAAPDSFRSLRLAQNVGKGEAVRQGVLAAAKDDPTYIGYWDADLATPLDAIGQFESVLERKPDVQLVTGARVQLLGRTIARSAWRHYLGRVFATCASRLLCLPVYDTQCGAKLFRARPAVVSLFESPWHSRWAFDVELLARLSESADARQGQRTSQAVVEVPLRQWQDMPDSKVGARAMVRAGWDVVRLWRRYHRACKAANGPRSAG